MAQDLLGKLERVESLLKHQPGRHPQQRHAGTRGKNRSTAEIATAGAYVMSEIMQDERMRKLASAMAADGPIDDVQNVVEAINDELPGFSDVYLESNPDMAEGKLDVPEKEAAHITSVAEDMYSDYEVARGESGWEMDIVSMEMTPERRAWEQKYYGKEVGGFNKGFAYADAELKKFVRDKIPKAPTAKATAQGKKPSKSKSARLSKAQDNLDGLRRVQAINERMYVGLSPEVAARLRAVDERGIQQAQAEVDRLSS